MRARLIALLTALLAVVALTGLHLTPAQAATTEPSYAALGDSIPVGFGATATDLLPGCDQPGGAYPVVVPSAKAYPNLLAGSPAEVKLLACSSATIGDVLADQVPLVPSAAKQVTLTVGANDLNYSELLIQCSLGQCPTAAELAKQIGRIPGKLAKLITAIHKQAPKARIFVTGYPSLFQPKVTLAKGKLTPTCAPLPQVDAKLLATVDAATVVFNAAIAATAAASDLKSGYDVRYVNAAKPFVGHGICSGGASWINHPFLADGVSFNPIGLHPNASGQAAYAKAIKARGFTG